jgi:hypothetical protein
MRAGIVNASFPERGEVGDQAELPFYYFPTGRQTKLRRQIVEGFNSSPGTSPAFIDP